MLLKNYIMSYDFIFIKQIALKKNKKGSVKEMLNLSQQDYVKRIEELNQALVTAWDGDQRVKALKIVIQVGSNLVIFGLSPSSNITFSGLPLLKNTIWGVAPL